MSGRMSRPPARRVLSNSSMSTPRFPPISAPGLFLGFFSLGLGLASAIADLL